MIVDFNHPFFFGARYSEIINNFSVHYKYSWPNISAFILPWIQKRKEKG